MSRRRSLLAVSAVALLGLAGFALFFWLATPATTAPTPGVTWENFRRLREGMSVRDVEALIGPHQVEEGSRLWWGKDISISLRFAGDQLTHGYAMNDKRDNTFVSESLHPDESFRGRIRRWLDSPAIAVYHEERPYFAFAIAAGVLALLLWLYRRPCRLDWQSLLAVALLGLAGFALFLWLANPASTPGVTLDNFPPAVYHEGRPYFTFAIAAGVLALLLWLYRKRLKLSSPPK